ncbi:MAG: hypothetical protein ABIS38_08685, partial [Sphingomicrobium sp.]
PKGLRVQSDAGASYVANRTSSAFADGAAVSDCGIFPGQRRCGKEEARKFGYGGGRDPITFVSTLITKISDR